jgi:integrase
MSLAKQAKTLSKGQTEAVFGYLAKTRYSIRNRAIFLLSLKAGLRAKEIAFLTWEMITDADGEVGQAIHLQDKASKGRPGSLRSSQGQPDDKLPRERRSRSNEHKTTRRFHETSSE